MMQFGQKQAEKCKAITIASKQSLGSFKPQNSNDDEVILNRKGASFDSN